MIVQIRADIAQLMGGTTHGEPHLGWQGAAVDGVSREPRPGFHQLGDAGEDAVVRVEDCADDPCGVLGEAWVRWSFSVRSRLDMSSARRTGKEDRSVMGLQGRRAGMDC